MFFENGIFRDKKSAWKQQRAAEHRGKPAKEGKGVERRAIRVKGAQQSRQIPGTNSVLVSRLHTQSTLHGLRADSQRRGMEQSSRHLYHCHQERRWLC